jgi:RHS repeat-associated protein
MGGLGQVTHLTTPRRQKASISSPYFSEEYWHDPVGNLISSTTNGKEQRYTYDGLSQLSSESDTDYVHDSLYNRVQENGKHLALNDLNELLESSYDLKGNQILRQTPSGISHFAYDPLNRLIEVTSQENKINFVYDPLGRRLTKAVYSSTIHGWQETDREYYLYHDQNEMGAFTAYGEPKNLNIPGRVKHRDCPISIGIEWGEQVFAPLLDAQRNIRCLVDLKTKAIVESSNFTAFGKEVLTHSQPDFSNPWRFASKRLDPELGLIYFGNRYYDPSSGRWLTTDPAGFIDSVNLYQYVFNNPYRYRDPDGKFIIALPLLALTWKVLAVAAVTAYVSYELERQHHHSNSELARSFHSAVHQVVQNVGGVSHYMLNRKLNMSKKRDLRTEDDKEKKPPYSGTELGDDPTKAPGEGFEWRGKGPRGSKEGSWHNIETGESLHPDLKHPLPQKPHWDYVGPNYPGGVRLNLDGTWEHKS